jgi:K+ transporter
MPDEPLHQHASDPPPLAPALDDPPQAPRPFPEEEHRAPGAHRSRGTGTLVLTLGALGVVYGDIGTSPLYAMREAFHGAHGLALTAANILGVASLAVWSLILMISLKYVTFILRADNHGEGGTLALLGLIPPRLSRGLPYVPFVNGLMMLLCLALVLGFRSSSALAGAYGLSVTGTMMATSIGFFVVMRRVWGMRLLTAGAVAGVFLVIDGAFLGANLVKIADGGWVPLSIALALLACTLIWRDGRRRLASLTKRRTISVDAFLDRTDVQSARRVPGTGVFLTSGTTGVPPTLAHHLERVGILHREVVLLTVQTLDVPFVQPSHRLRVTELGRGPCPKWTRGMTDELNTTQAWFVSERC